MLATIYARFSSAEQAKGGWTHIEAQLVRVFTKDEIAAYMKDR